MKTAFEKWFETFLDEKDLPYEMFELTIEGETHLIDTDCVIEAIKNCNPDEKKKIKDTIVKLDFMNKSINAYFKYLAEAMIRTRG